MTNDDQAMHFKLCFIFLQIVRKILSWKLLIITRQSFGNPWIGRPLKCACNVSRRIFWQRKKIWSVVMIIMKVGIDSRRKVMCNSFHVRDPHFLLPTQGLFLQLTIFSGPLGRLLRLIAHRSLRSLTPQCSALLWSLCSDRFACSLCSQASLTYFVHSLVGRENS